MRSRSDAAARAPHSLEFYNGQILYRSQNGNGEEARFLSPSAVCAAFRNAPIDSGWLAPGVIRCGATPSGEFAVLFVPPQKHSIVIAGRKRSLDVNLPAFVFFGYHNSFYVWSIKEKEFRAGAEVFRAPLPNVFAEGSICWGENRPPKAGAATITNAWSLFISSPFTDHAADLKSKSHERDVRQLLISLGGSPFPLTDLVSQRRKIDGAINSILGGSYESELD